MPYFGTLRRSTKPMRRSSIERLPRSTGRLAILSVSCSFVLLMLFGGTSSADSVSVGTPKNAAVSSSAARALEADCPRGPNVYDIGYGATGTAVREVQCLLNWALSAEAYPYINVDGEY